jgi:hypothetical protein
MSDLSENEKLLFTKIGSNSFEDVKQLLNESDVRINSCDENGMNALSHSSYKGNYEICKYLIERGADVNDRHHVHGYTALMFAAIGGHKNVVNLLLETGADVNCVNSVGRNAAQMAAFVGQHSSVSIINSFISREQIEYFTQIRGLESEPKLSSRLVSPLHSFVRQTNINPIRIALFLKSNWILIENGNKVLTVVELLCEKQIKSKEPNEMISLKLHHLGFVLKQIIKVLNKNEKNLENIEKSVEKKEEDIKKLESLMKSWLKPRETDGFPLFLEKMLRQSIKEFPYHESTLFQQLVRTLATVEIGEEPSACTILSQAINGQKGFDEDSPVCGTCGEPNPSKKCSQCKLMPYCNQECQKLHWNSHKKLCHPNKSEIISEK